MAGPLLTKVPAPLDEACPRCRAANPNLQQVSVWRVADERGPHLECDSCGHAWRGTTSVALRETASFPQ